MSDRFWEYNQPQLNNVSDNALTYHAAVVQADSPGVASQPAPGHFGHDFSGIAVQAAPGLQRDLAATSGDGSTVGAADPTQLLSQATSDQAAPLDRTVQQPLEQRFGRDLSQVRVYQGTASAQAAEQLGARAYTLGNRIFLGSEAASLNSADRSRLLAHEAVHTVQQGGASVIPHSGLTVSNPNDAAEVEARDIADSLHTANVPSRSLALRDSLRSNIGQPGIARSVAPQVQRDLTGKKTVNDGDFELDLKTKSNPGASSGLEGTIKFTPSSTAPDAATIRLLQVVRTEDLTTNKDYVWTGSEANRNKMMTTDDKKTGVQGGYFVDHLAGKVTPRTAKGDKAVSPYYIDYTPNARKAGLAKDGSKSGKTVTAASLYDFPQSDTNMRFSFETAAKSTTGYTYATLTWGFTVSDGAKGKVDSEYADAHRSPSKTLSAAVKAFNEFYKNPGSSTAP